MSDFSNEVNEYMPLRDVVFKTLRQAILKGDMVPGERLMEIQLAKKLGVSRTPIREAIRKLELEGLVTMVQRKEILRMLQQEVMPLKLHEWMKNFTILFFRQQRMINWCKCSIICASRCIATDWNILRMKRHARHCWLNMKKSLMPYSQGR